MLWLITVGCGLAGLAAVVAGAAGVPVFRWLGLAMMLLVGICGLFSVRGYEVSKEAVVVRRLVWDWRLPLAALQSVEADSQAMSGSLRLWGVGGCFSWSGLYWNRRLGQYWTAVTDPAKAVVLRWDRKVVVLSPEVPERLVEAVGRVALATGLQGAGGAAGNPGFSGGFHLE